MNESQLIKLARIEIRSYISDLDAVQESHTVTDSVLQQCSLLVPKDCLPSVSRAHTAAFVLLNIIDEMKNEGCAIQWTALAQDEAVNIMKNSN